MCVHGLNTWKRHGPLSPIHCLCSQAFHCPEAYASPEAAVLTRLFVKLLDDRLSELSYEAELAGLGYSALNTTYRFMITFGGCDLHVSVPKPPSLSPLSSRSKSTYKWKSINFMRSSRGIIRGCLAPDSSARHSLQRDAGPQLSCSATSHSYDPEAHTLS